MTKTSIPQPTIPAIRTALNGRDYQIVVPNGYVRTADGTILVQLADNSQHGFSLHDDEQSWPGGFGIAREWTLIPASEVSAEDQARLGWILEQAAS